MEGDERMEMLVNSCIRGLGSTRINLSREFCAAEPREEGRQAVTKFRKVVSMIISMEGRKRCNMVEEFKRLKTG